MLLLICALLLVFGASLELVGLVLGIVGLLVGAIAIPLGAAEGGKQVRQLKEVRVGLGEAIDELKTEVQTHHIGPFPDFLPEIVSILAEATRSITIFCDLPAYGVVSNRDEFEKYVEVIEAKARRKGPPEVRMLHLGRSARMESVEAQFDSWAAAREKPSVTAFLAAAGKAPGEDDERQAFLDLVEQSQKETLASLRAAGVDTNPTGQIMPLYFWIADSKAVFALTEFSPHAHEAGFCTSSTNLIRAMEGIYGRYLRSPQAASPAAGRYRSRSRL